jgi:flagellar biosynthesis/type III secretory pathway protein FliH
MEIIEAMEGEGSGESEVINLNSRRMNQSRAVWANEAEESPIEEEPAKSDLDSGKRSKDESEVGPVAKGPKAPSVPVQPVKVEPSVGNKVPPKSARASTVMEAADMLDEAADLLEEPILTLEQIVEMAREEAVLETRELMSAEMESMKVELARVNEIHESLAPLVESLSGMKKRIYQESARNVADLALHVARRVVGETLAVHPESLRTLVENALSRLPGDDEVRVRLRPDDIAVVEGYLPTRRSIRLIPDETLEGGCVVEAQCGEVEASLEVAFVGLRQAVSEWLEDQKG